MHSETLEKTGSPRKRTLSRGLSEDESLRSIFKETENASRRCGSLKRGSDIQQSDQDLMLGLPEVLELQNYDEVLQELRRLELEREGLLFQVDVLQDTLEGAEELLAETQREAGQASMELEREREAKRKLEDTVRALVQEVERLKEERNTIPAVPVYTLVREQEKEEEARQEKEEEAAANQTEKKDAQERVAEAQSKHAAPFSVIPLDNNTSAQTQRSAGGSLDEEGAGGGAPEEAGPLAKLQRMVNKTFGHAPSLAAGSQPSQDGVFTRPQAEDNDTDSISAYEDASAETPELENIFPGAGEERVDGGEEDDEDDEERPANASQAKVSDPHNESCILS